MVPAVKGANHYIWTLPSGDTLVKDSRITVQFNASINYGVIKVKGCNQYGCGSESNTLRYTIMGRPAAAGLISGETDVCNVPTTQYTYTVPVIEGATSYLWLLPTASSGVSETNSISLSFYQFVGGPGVDFNLGVQGVNKCGIGDMASLQISPPHGPPIWTGTVTGASKVCKGTSALLYKVEGMKAESYSWILPNGAGGLSISDTISVNFGNSAVSGDIRVRGINHCGEGEETIFSVEVIDVPVPEISLISGILYSNALAGNQWYLNNALIPGASDTSYTPQEFGRYTVITSVEGCASQPSMDYNYNPTYISAEAKNGIIVYPNSTSGQLEVRILETLDANYSIEVYNLFSRITSYEKQYAETITTIDLSDFPSGIYFVQVRVKNRTYLFKIIKN